MDIWLDFAELKRRGLFRNRVTLTAWIRREGFPPGQLLGPNCRRWRESEIEAWLDSRPQSRERRKVAS